MKQVAKFAAIVSALTLGATVALADPVKERKELMKSVGKSTKLAAQMVKGQVPFDASQAEAAMKTISSVPDKYVTLFPEGSGDDPETEASPKIWQDMAGFKKKAEQLKSDSAAAAEAAKNGLNDFKAAFGNLVKNCKSCHEAYRIKKN